MRGKRASGPERALDALDEVHGVGDQSRQGQRGDVDGVIADVRENENRAARRPRAQEADNRIVVRVEGDELVARELGRRPPHVDEARQSSEDPTRRGPGIHSVGVALHGTEGAVHHRLSPASSGRSREP